MRLAAGLALALLVSATAGCSAPRVIPSSELSELHELERALAKQEDYESRWKAAVLCLDVVDGPYASSAQKDDYAGRALKHCDVAVKLEPKRVEGHFYRAVSLGRVLEHATLPTRGKMLELEAAGKRAMELDPAFRCAGPVRLLALLYQKAPVWPLGPVNARDEEVVEELFLKAIKHAPECPENHVAYAEFLKEEDRKPEARKFALKARALLPKATDLTKRRDLSKRIRELLAALKS